MQILFRLRIELATANNSITTKKNIRRTQYSTFYYQLRNIKNTEYNVMLLATDNTDDLHS